MLQTMITGNIKTWKIIRIKKHQHGDLCYFQCSVNIAISDVQLYCNCYKVPLLNHLNNLCLLGDGSAKMLKIEKGTNNIHMQ